MSISLPGRRRIGWRLQRASLQFVIGAHSDDSQNDQWSHYIGTLGLVCHHLHGKIWQQVTSFFFQPQLASIPASCLQPSTIASFGMATYLLLCGQSSTFGSEMVLLPCGCGCDRLRILLKIPSPTDAISVFFFSPWTLCFVALSASNHFWRKEKKIKKSLGLLVNDWVIQQNNIAKKSPP